MSVLEGVVRFAHIPPDAEEAPEEWVREHGQEKAERLFRLAGYGLMASAKAPVGIKTAKDVATGILKARATERLGPRTININTVVMPEARVPQYERKKIE